MRRLLALIILSLFVFSGCVTVSVPKGSIPKDDSRSIQRSNEAHKELDQMNK